MHMEVLDIPAGFCGQERVRKAAVSLFAGPGVATFGCFADIRQ